jgi:hypothetical protein
VVGPTRNIYVQPVSSNCGKTRSHLKTVRQAMTRRLSIPAAIIALGYFSSVLSVNRCEAIIAERIAADIGRRDVFVLPGSSVYAENRLKRAGFVTRKCSKNEDCFSWAELCGLPTVWPYVVTVTWGYVAAPLGGEGNRTTFFCVFGFAIEVSEKGRWVT